MNYPTRVTGFDSPLLDLHTFMKLLRNLNHLKVDVLNLVKYAVYNQIKSYESKLQKNTHRNIYKDFSYNFIGLLGLLSTSEKKSKDRSATKGYFHAVCISIGVYRYKTNGLRYQNQVKWLLKM